MKNYKYQEELYMLNEKKINCSISKTSIDLNNWINMISNIENRKELILYGNILACNYLYNLDKFNNKNKNNNSC